MTTLAASTMKHECTPTGRGAWARTACRVLLGLLFIAAGLLKLQDAQKFLFSVKGFKILPDHLAYSTAFMLPVTEILAGSMLVIGVWARGAALVIVGLLVGFIAGVISVIVRGIDTNCSCFGDFEWPCKGAVGWCQVVRNLFMIALGLPVIVWGAGRAALERTCCRSARCSA